MTWQKPTGKERSCRPSDKILPGEKATFCRSIKASLLISETIFIGNYAIVGREKQGETQRDP